MANNPGRPSAENAAWTAEQIKKVTSLTSPAMGTAIAASAGNFDVPDESAFQYWQDRGGSDFSQYGGGYAEDESEANDVPVYDSTTGAYTGKTFPKVFNDPRDALNARPVYYRDEEGNVVSHFINPNNYTGTNPARISVMPTSTTNPLRPRTVAAGYDVTRSVLTVVFRDGTYYNYYGIPEKVWSAFRNTQSKGRFIAANLDDQYQRGPANVAQTPKINRELLYRMARGHQYTIGMTKQNKPRVKGVPTSKQTYLAGGANKGGKNPSKGGKNPSSGGKRP